MTRAPMMLVLACLVAGCTLPVGLAGSIAAGGGAHPVAGASPEPLAGYSFKPLSAADMGYLSASTSTSGSSSTSSVSTGSGTAAATAPAAGAAVATSGAAVPTAAMGIATGGSVGKAIAMPYNRGYATGVSSGDVDAYYGGYDSYFGGEPGDQMALVSITEAQAAGLKGSFTDLIKTVADPVVKAWTSDARLISSTATLDGSGHLVDDPMPGVINAMGPGAVGTDAVGNAWQLVYASTSRNEVLHFFARSDKTVILRMRWAPQDLTADQVTVDATTAIQKLTAAIADPNAKSAEETSGTDYFTGVSFSLPAAEADMAEVQPVDSVPSDARWNVSLDEVLGRVVWNLSFNQAFAMETGVATAVAVAPMASNAGVAKGIVSAGPMPIDPAPSQDPGYWLDNSGSGMVDAMTGAVIRFTRPSKHFYNVPTDIGVTQPGIAVTPVIVKPPLMVPSPLPAVPAPSASPTPTGI